MRIEDFDAIRRFVEQACVRHRADILTVTVSKRVARFVICKKSRYPCLELRSLKYLEPIEDDISQEMGRRGWNIDTDCNNGTIGVELKP